MAQACTWWQNKTFVEDPAAAQPQFRSGFSNVSQPRVTRLRDLYDPKPEPPRAPVRIRPPSPRSPVQEPVFRRSSLSDTQAKPIMRKRSRSLPLSTERQRESRNLQVRFVDSLGLELEDVKFFEASEDPLIPQHVISRLLMKSELTCGKAFELSLPYFKPCFPSNMGAKPDFQERLRSQRVCLEQVLCSEVGIIGTAQVLNLAYEKEVSVHYSFTNWRTSVDTKASWVSTVHGQESCRSESDVFRFRLPVPPFILQPGALLEFALRYRVSGCEYWDDNDGHHYKLSCHTYKLVVPKECEDSMLHFV